MTWRALGRVCRPLANPGRQRRRLTLHSVTSRGLAGGRVSEPSDDVLRDMHRRMVRIRVFETEAGRLAEAGKIPGALHLYVGEEAVAAGVMVHLSDDEGQ